MLLQSLIIALCLVSGIFMLPAEKVTRKVQRKRVPQVTSPPPGFHEKPQRPPPHFDEKPPHPPPNFEERPPHPPQRFEERPPHPPQRFEERPPHPPQRFEERPPHPPPRFEDRPPPPQFIEGPIQPPHFENKPPPPQPYHDEYAEPRNYEFNFLVDDQYTGNFQTREETKDGTRTVGSYALREPTGAIRIVKYIADHNGFRAIVQRIWPDDDKSNH